MIKTPSANAGDAGLIPGLGRSPVEGNGGLQSMGLQRVEHNLVTKHDRMDAIGFVNDPS